MPRLIRSRKGTNKSVLNAMRSKSPNSAAVAKKLSAALRRELVSVGIRGARIVTETIPGTRLRRLIVISRAFDQIDYYDRQAFVWQAVERNLSTAERVLITQIVTVGSS